MKRSNKLLDRHGTQLRDLNRSEAIPSSATPARKRRYCRERQNLVFWPEGHASPSQTSKNTDTRKVARGVERSDWASTTEDTVRYADSEWRKP